jgi:hypothetical protein
MPCSFSNRPNAGLGYCERATGGCRPDLLVAGVRVRFKSAETLIVQRNISRLQRRGRPRFKSATMTEHRSLPIYPISGRLRSAAACLKSADTVLQKPKIERHKISQKLSLRRLHRCNGLWRRYDGRRSLLSETIHYVLFAQDEANLWTLPRRCVLPTRSGCTRRQPRHAGIWDVGCQRNRPQYPRQSPGISASRGGIARADISGGLTHTNEKTSLRYIRRRTKKIARVANVRQQSRAAGDDGTA